MGEIFAVHHPGKDEVVGKGEALPLFLQLCFCWHSSSVVWVSYILLCESDKKNAFLRESGGIILQKFSEVRPFRKSSGNKVVVPAGTFPRPGNRLGSSCPTGCGSPHQTEELVFCGCVC